MRVLVVSGGSPPSKELLLREVNKANLIIAADSGGEVLYKYSILPNIILGDFDSIDKDVLAFYKSVENDIYIYPPEKNFTDTELAFEKALEANAKEIVILGATGSRVDHVLGNLGLLCRGLDNGVRTTIKDNNNVIFLVDKPIKLKGSIGQTISFQGFRETVSNFNIRNAKYELNNYKLNFGEPLTVSNEFVNEYMTIDFQSGRVLVLYSKD